MAALLSDVSDRIVEIVATKIIELAKSRRA
jgi:hypothetical protein